MTHGNVDLSIIVPIFNEEMNVVPLNNRILQSIQSLNLSCEIIYINDGSTDASAAILRGLSESYTNIKYIDFSRNFGHQIAITAGIEHAIGTRIVIMDGDGQDPPELIPDLYNKSLEGFEVVYAKRKKRKGESWLKKITAKQIAWIGFNATYVEYDREERMGGSTKFTYGKMMRFATDGISSFSNWPLKMATLLGFAVSGIAFLLLIYSLYQKFFGYTEVGWTSLHISVLFLGGVQLLGIGILGEYLGRVSENVKNRPTYIVKDSNIHNLNAH